MVETGRELLEHRAHFDEIEGEAIGVELGRFEEDLDPPRVAVGRLDAPTIRGQVMGGFEATANAQAITRHAANDTRA